MNRSSTSRETEVACTISQMLGMKNRAGTIVAMAHRYVLADGSVGESGKADPKFLFHEGTVYKVEICRKCYRDRPCRLRLGCSDPPRAATLCNFDAQESSEIRPFCESRADF